MEQTYLSDDVIKRIKGFNRLKLSEKQISMIDQLILNEDLKTCYKMYGLCKTCNQPNIGYDWCQLCNAKYFQQDFKKWTSGNHNVDEFIREVQLQAKTKNDVVEWIDYNRFKDTEYLATGGFGVTYKSNWKDGYIIYRDSVRNRWERSDTIQVVLKRLHNSQNITMEFLRRIESHIRMNNTYFTTYCYGFTKDPETKNFILVMEYAENGNLRTNLDKNFNSMDWWNKLYILEEIASGLKDIHHNGFIHHDFHSGNILNNIMMSNCITDLGLFQPANQSDKKKIYGVLPYVAPEVLREKKYTQASDIYGFGIIAYEVVTGLPPHYNISHEEALAIRICQGLRPISDYEVPQSILNIIQQCWDADPLNRPRADELHNSLYNLRCETSNTNSIIYKEIKDVNKLNNQTSAITSPVDSKHAVPLSPTKSFHDAHEELSYPKHPRAVYTSRLLDFENLPEPENVEIGSYGIGTSGLEDFTNLRINTFV